MKRCPSFGKLFSNLCIWLKLFHRLLAMLGGMPYTALRDAVFTHPTMLEGLIPLFSAVPPKNCARGCRVRRKCQIYFLCQSATPSLRHPTFDVIWPDPHRSQRAPPSHS
jgi:hypothetical protein